MMNLPLQTATIANSWLRVALVVFGGIALPDNAAMAFHFPWDQGHDTFTPQPPGDGDDPGLGLKQA